jgi:hypothetical protein
MAFFHNSVDGTMRTARLSFRKYNATSGGTVNAAATAMIVGSRNVTANYTTLVSLTVKLDSSFALRSSPFDIPKKKAPTIASVPGVFCYRITLD